MNIFNYIAIVLRNVFSNIHYLGKYDLASSIKHHNDIQEMITKLSILSYFQNNQSEAIAFSNELKYLYCTPDLDVFPYEQVKKLPTPIKAAFDPIRKLPFIVHQGKRLFFPENWSLEDCEKSYTNFIERENILGGGYTSKAPHQYEDKNIKIEQNDILLDIGCAEGLLALDTIEKTKFTYLFEGNPIWIKPLQATFAPFSKKIKIINKYVSGNDSKSETTLISLFGEIKNESFFVKMDIEGAEADVLNSNQSFFQSENFIKIACCTYHKKQDAETISKILKKWDFSSHFSDGYMLYFVDKDFIPPYFRKGLIRAKNR